MRALCLMILLCLASLALADDSGLLYDTSQVGRIDITVDPADLEWVYQNVQSDSMHACTVRFRNAVLDTVMSPVGFRLRGNTSRASAKKSFKLKFDEYIDGLEFFDVDALNLNGEHNDPTISRSRLLWHVFGMAGVPASRACHTEVWINDSYYGLYVSVEHVDREFLRKRFTDPSGNLWKCLWPADLLWLGADPEAYKLEVNGRRVYELKTNEELDDYSALQRLVRVVNQTPPAAMRDSLEAVLAVEDVTRVLAVDALTGNWDTYRYLRNNYYLYHDPASGLMRWIPYDYDNNLGIDWFTVDWATLNPYNWPVLDGNGRPLTAAVLSVPAYRDLYTHFLERGLEQLVTGYPWGPWCDELRTLLTPAAAADLYRTYDYGFTLQDFQQSWSLSPYENQHVKRGLQEFLALRAQTLPGQLAWQYGGPVLWDGRVTALGGDSLEVSAMAFSAAGMDSLVLLASLDGQPLAPVVLDHDPRPGRALDALDHWSTRLPVPGGGSYAWRLRGRDSDGVVRHWPAAGSRVITLETPGSDSLRFVEFMPDNDGVIADGQGDFDDWVEILNGSRRPVNLAGCGLSDDPDQPWRFQFPDTVLAPGARLLVWCDNDTGDPGLHAGFALSAGGEQLLLTTAGGRRVQELGFGSSAEDLSWQLPCDRGLESGSDPGAWRDRELPTPAAPNHCSGVSDLRITRLANVIQLEWSPGGGRQWRVERYPGAPWLGGAQTVAIVDQPFWEEALPGPGACYTVREILQP
jgi:spore coat protein H